jgi:UrcA family protein
MFAPIKTAAALATVLSLTAAAPAFAGSGGEAAPTARVFHGDLDLSSAHDVKRLEARVQRASAGVCLRYQGTAFYTCRKETIANSKASINAAIARAETRARYADAGAAIQVGN